MNTVRHPHAQRFAIGGLFKGLASFRDLELRIQSLPTEQERGLAFEVFAEAFLNVIRQVDFQSIWPLAVAPIGVLESLAISARDFGIDGIAFSRSEHYAAYQVKFRSNRPSLTWRELSTFFGLTDCPQIKTKILFTNCDDLAEVINTRANFFCIRGSDLDRLSSIELDAIDEFVRTGVKLRQVKKPRAHQEEALTAITEEFQRANRTSCIMPCGSGKSLVALWLIERLQSRNTIVLVPSLALLRQLLHDWLRQTKLENLAYLCVCSDPTVDLDRDDYTVNQSDLDFPVSTNPEAVRGFLEWKTDAPRIIFSTYQSARNVASGLPLGFKFDLGIFDEAHKTAGHVKGAFSYALSDQNIPIEKRTFFTATPRICKRRDEVVDENDEFLFSMDDPAVFGREAYRLSFAEAIKRNLICDYKIIVSAITSTDVNNYLLEKANVEISGQIESAKLVATHIAVKNAINKHGIKKIFTFHGTVAKAEEFSRIEVAAIESDNSYDELSCTEDFNKNSTGNRSTLIPTNPKITKFHINGAMPTSIRERILHEFRQVEFGLISNARCLTEGVDVPAVEMVVFSSPKRSTIDIVQAAGRAMRTSPNKKCGYILLPIFVEEKAGEDFKTAIARADFSSIWEVLQALRDEDELLEERIANAQQERGRTGDSGIDEMLEYFEFDGITIDKEVLKKSIQSRCLDIVGNPWDEKFGQLKMFRKEFGHCRVPFNYSKIPNLGQWLNNQRQRFKKGQLDSARRRKLESIGVEWSPGLYDEDSWNEKFEQLKEFYSRNGHFSVPRHSENTRKLGEWLNNQRTNYRRGLLTEKRIQAFEEIGCDLSKFNADLRWANMLETLVGFWQRCGSIEPKRNSSDPLERKLSTWVMHQRESYAKGQLSGRRQEDLEKIGFKFQNDSSLNRKTAIAKSVADLRWEKMFTLLDQFLKEKGDTNVSRSNSQTEQLGVWVTNQRALRRKGLLSPDRIEKLDGIGFKWELPDSEDRWESRFEELKEYKAKNGTTCVPQREPSVQKLASWVAQQRQARKKGLLKPERFQKLEDIGFVWALR